MLGLVSIWLLSKVLEFVAIVVYPVQVFQHGAAPNEFFPPLAGCHVFLFDVSFLTFFTLEPAFNDLFDGAVEAIAVLAGPKLLRAIISIVHQKTTSDQFRRLAPVLSRSVRAMKRLVFCNDFNLKP